MTSTAPTAARQPGRTAFDTRSRLHSKFGIVRRNPAFLHQPSFLAGRSAHSMDGSARPRDGALSPTSLASRETSTTYYTAQNFDRMTLLSFTTSSAYYSMEDPAALRVTTEPELRAAFRELDITDKVTISSTTPLGIGGNADVMQGELVVEQTRTMRVSQRVRIVLPHRLHAAERARDRSPSNFQGWPVPSPTYFEYAGMRHTCATELYLVQKLGREIAIWRTLSHPNILALTGLYWGAARLPGMVSPWCKNGNLCSYLAARVMDDKDKLPLKCQLVRQSLFYGRDRINAVSWRMRYRG